MSRRNAARRRSGPAPAGRGRVAGNRRVRRRSGAISRGSRIFRRRYNKGYNRGFEKGYNEGMFKGRAEAGTLFEGVSIVIPSYNQADLLWQCLHSIAAHTPEPHEVIVVDNGSRDQTATGLKKRTGRVRWRLCGSNLGFAGGVNQGLKMARGRCVLFLNNDTVVTEGWLGNLLGCLHGLERDSLVGPVTNHISGEQRVASDYASLAEMQQFARSFNTTDSGKWTVTGRLTGFCVIMKREVLERLCMLDEGFVIGNFEDDDYGLRARLLGIDLVIAKDTFIHHVGSASMKSLGDRLESVNDRNHDFYSQKWGDVSYLLQEVQEVRGKERTLKSADLYPTHVVVRGAGGTSYWIEHGVRHPIAGGWPGESVRLSQLDVRQYAAGESLTAEETAAKLATLAQVASAYGPIAEGIIVRTPDGTPYQSDRGTLRRIVGGRALAAWLLNRRSEYAISAETAAELPRGLPIIAPPVIQADNV